MSFVIPILSAIVATLIVIESKDLLKVSLILFVLHTLFKYFNVEGFAQVYHHGFTWAHLLEDWSWRYLPFVLTSYLFLFPIALLTWRSRHEIFWGTKSSILLGILLATASTFCFGFLIRDRLSTNVLTYLLTAITWSSLGGFVEEPLYRGTLTKGLSQRFNWWLAWLIQAACFGISHIWSVGAILSALIFGLILGVIAKYLGLWSSIAMHSIANLVAHNLI